MEFYIEILLVWIAFIVGVFQENFGHILRDLWRDPRHWRWVVKGMWGSKTFVALALLIAMSVGIYFLNSTQENASDKNTDRIIDAINKQTEKLDVISNKNLDIFNAIQQGGINGNTATPTTK
ncbi:MAG: hypothetical protein HYX96_03595 [Chloroflexi bacterium]|nr:hypothetical protein [Chloroflexota bacterium]